MRALTTPLLLTTLAACGPKREPESLASLGPIVVEVPLPAEDDGVGAAFFEARVADLPRGREWVTPREGVTMLCRSGSGGRLEIRVMIERSQIGSLSGVVAATCPFGEGLPVTIRW
jgi:hypothetical protein